MGGVYVHFAGLCHTCGSTYEEGKFCETFHLSASGWRCCETCGKQIHCGCIVSFHMFVLLDAGGIECLTYARKSLIMTPNPAWPLPSLVLSSHPERIEDLSGKNWSTMAGSGPVPWRKAPSLFNGYIKSQQAKASLEFDVPSGTDILHFSDKMSAFSFERQNNEDSVKRLSGEKTCRPDILDNRFSGKTDENLNMATVSAPTNKSADTSTASTRALKSSNHSGLDVSTDKQVRSGKSKGDARGTNHFLARYSPQITVQERIQISGENHIITHLFEKTLSASDAGRMGRLILPKRCAEAYLPSISDSDGLPLEVGDSKGNEWLFQFRFWPNNHSRMYVLEGVTPCIQSLQLQAGDIVTFSRLEPEGKLMIGGRKALATTSTDQENKAVTMIDGMSANGVNMKKCSKQSETDLASINKPEEQFHRVVSNRTKRKGSILASKSKRSMIENGYMTKLKLTLKEAQGLISPPPGNNPKVIVIEGFELEEYEDVPIIGRPSILSSDYTGEEIQWVQCDDCLKWRKVPTKILLPSKWTCSANLLDQEKSMCSAAQELTAEHLTDVFLAISNASSKKSSVSKPDSDSVETLEALNALANIALQEGALLHATTRHPRHKPGCSCIVCMQPPSGKGPKHEQSCDCVVCESLRRRFRTLMTGRLEKKQPDIDAEMTLQKLANDSDADLLGEVLTGTGNQDVANCEGLNNDYDENEIFASPSNVKIDLNSQPERDKELAFGSDILSMLDLIHEASGIHLEQQNHSGPTDGETLGGHDIHQKGLMGAMFSSCVAFDGSHERIDIDCQSALPADIVAASASTAQ